MSNHPLRFACAALICAASVLASPGHAGLLDTAKGALNSLKSGNVNPTQTTGVLSSADIINGLKEALRLGSEKVISQVGQPDGYLTDKAIHIPLPENLTTVHKALDKFGFGSLTADLETRINRAAEKAAPAAKDVFWTSISEMTVDDAKRILDGSKTAATDYFRQHMSAPLTERFTPIIDASLAEVGAVKAYDQVMGQYKTLPFVPDVKSDLTRHAVARALDGLFHYLAIEEAAIRENPAARTTAILKKVFAN
ncbi:MAG: DUF4197 domain-containing protein [Rhodospirillales bacterium]|nr:DUF4197 domain-containing protein [Rhodospirillales bacterium]